MQTRAEQRAEGLEGQGGQGLTVIADESVMIVVCLLNHLIDLLLGHLSTDVAHYKTELAGVDVALWMNGSWMDFIGE